MWVNSKHLRALTCESNRLVERRALKWFETLKAYHVSKFANLTRAGILKLTV